MPARTLHCDVTGTSGVVSVNIDQDYGQPTANAVVECTSTTLDLGDSIEIDMGYNNDYPRAFTGYVLEKQCKRGADGFSYSLRCRDQLWRAMAYFIAATDPQAPLKYSNIESRDLVHAMLDLASITSHDLNSPGFTWAPEKPLEVNLMSAWDMIAKICQLIAWHCYDDDGTVKFNDRKPYNVPGDTSVHTFVTGDDAEIIGIEPMAISSDKIRNRVVVYGAEGVHAEASASSPFLPPGFYKTEVISAPNLIDTNAIAQDIANYNLDLLNRLEKTLTLNVIGVPGLRARSVVTVTESLTGVSGDWFVYNIRHNMSNTYQQTLTLVQRQTS